MQSIVIYYSYSGNTKQVARVLAELLAQKGEVEEIELKCLDEPRSFFAQCKRAFRRVRGKIQEATLDLSGYDLVCLGTPVWALSPAPAINTCLDQAVGLGGKRAVLFTTYGSGTGNQRCINYMQEFLSKKGATAFSRFSIQQAKVKDKEFIVAEVNKALRLWPNG
ncbi:MAG: flavodoxin [Candidatus Omnitrophica bacterium]|nr:flavodoxin [Candidatus Omnitrophota bacterium]